MADPQTTDPAADQAMALLRELRLTPMQGCVGIGHEEWFVHIFDGRKKPPITRWMGWPVSYHIGGGMPRAYGAGA